MSSPNRIAAHAFPHAQPVPAYDLPSRRTSLHSHSALGDSVSRPVESAVVAISGTQTRVLIADEERSAGPLAHLLHGLGYWLTKTACSGASALVLAQDFRPSIVLIALDLPDMSAGYIGRRIRQWTADGQVRLIALADDRSLASRDRVRESGFPRYLTKPISAAALQQVLRASLS